MKTKILFLFILYSGIILISTLTTEESTFHPEFKEHKTVGGFGITSAFAYPPAVGILTNSTNCLSCHINNGAWKDDLNTIIDIVDMDTKKSLKQNDEAFLIEVDRGVQKTVLTVIGSKRKDPLPVPYRNAWLYIDPATIGKPSLSKFAPDWEVNLPMSCRLVGDKLAGYENADITSLPMTIQPLENALDAEIVLQVMLTKGESVKSNVKEGMVASYFERKVKLKVK